ncbi:hypothetical protein AB0F39_34610 [Streptomyces murinus]|uniref:hypothetical protein n=1 Tax=Streptomyces murinus TaxID=33900 RepID=UPI0033D4E1F7
MARRQTDSDGYTRTVLPAPRCWPASARPWRLALGGDELRARAYLWRLLGVGAAAAGRQQ